MEIVSWNRKAALADRGEDAMTFYKIHCTDTAHIAHTELPHFSVGEMGALWPVFVISLSDLAEVHTAHCILYCCLLLFSKGPWFSVLHTSQTQAKYFMAGKVILLYVNGISIISDRCYSLPHIMEN